MIQFDYSSIDLYKAYGKYKLSSVLGEDNFFYGLFHEQTGRLVKAKYITDLQPNYYEDAEVLDKLLEEEKLTKKNISSSVFAFANMDFSLLPIQIQPENNLEFAKSFSSLAFNEKYSLEIQEMAELGIALHYFVPGSSTDSLKNLFENVRFVHLNGALATAVSKKCRSSCLFMNWLNKSMQTVVFRDGRLIQTNHYELTGEHDALYFALLNARQHNFDPLNDQFYFAGPVPENIPALGVFDQHVEYFEPVKLSDRLKYTNVFLGKPKHLFFDLQAVAECVS